MPETLYSLKTDKEIHRHLCRRCQRTWQCKGRRDFCGIKDSGDLCGNCVDSLDRPAYSSYIRETISVRLTVKAKPVIIKPITAEDFFDV